jgi:hypothetical protein
LSFKNETLIGDIPLKNVLEDVLDCKLEFIPEKVYLKDIDLSQMKGLLEKAAGLWNKIKSVVIQTKEEVIKFNRMSMKVTF